MRRSAIRHKLAKKVTKLHSELIQTLITLRAEIETNHARVRVLDTFDSQFYHKVDKVFNDIYFGTDKQHVKGTIEAIEVYWSKQK